MVLERGVGVAEALGGRPVHAVGGRAGGTEVFVRRRVHRRHLVGLLVAGAGQVLASRRPHPRRPRPRQGQELRRGPRALRLGRGGRPLGEHSPQPRRPRRHGERSSGAIGLGEETAPLQTIQEHRGRGRGPREARQRRGRCRRRRHRGAVGRGGDGPESSGGGGCRCDLEARGHALEADAELHAPRLGRAPRDPPRGGPLALPRGHLAVAGSLALRRWFLAGRGPGGVAVVPRGSLLPGDVPIDSGIGIARPFAVCRLRDCGGLSLHRLAAARWHRRPTRRL
mmetsp:Transcript_37593/g.107872  ORF Transcript_37593/g.107872 Transcript_37593/m.107872 type:complete len:282 (+) Transcript_37593:633-1478(+)